MKTKRLLELEKIIDDELLKRFGEPFSGLHADISLGLKFAMKAFQEKSYIGGGAQILNALDFIEMAVRRQIKK